MKNYIEMLKDVFENGHDHPDRTGTGRRSVFGTKLEFDLAEGFPLVTTRKIFLTALVAELLWFIQGSTNNKDLTDKGVNIWSKWALGQKHIDEFIKEFTEDVENEDEKKAISAAIQSRFTNKLNGLGPIYGQLWRNAPNDKFVSIWPQIKLEDIPSDKIDLYKAEYDKIAEEHNPINGDLPSYEEFCQYKYYSTIDQLNDLVLNLKRNPYSARHVVSAWLPQFVPFETLTPQQNIMAERASLASCQAMFQCFVEPSKEPGSKKRLSLQIYQR